MIFYNYYHKIQLIKDEKLLCKYLDLAQCIIIYVLSNEDLSIKRANQPFLYLRNQIYFPKCYKLEVSTMISYQIILCYNISYFPFITSNDNYRLLVCTNKQYNTFFRIRDGQLSLLIDRFSNVGIMLQVFLCPRRSRGIQNHTGHQSYLTLEQQTHYDSRDVAEGI